MKKTKWIATLVALCMAALLALAGCDNAADTPEYADENDDSIEQPDDSGSTSPTKSDIAGNYRISIDGESYSFTFNENGTGTVKEAFSSNTRAIITVTIGTGGTSFTWTLSGSTVTVRIEGNAPFTLTYNKSTNTLSNPKLVNPLDSDDDDDSGESGDLPKATYTWDEDTKTITFTGPGEVTSDWIFDGNNRQYVVKKAIIEDGVTSIGGYAFSDCISLASVNIPDSVTSIGEAAFNACSELTSVTIGNSVTSIGEYAFAACSRLTSVNIPDGVQSIEKYAFSGCYYLRSITIPDSVTCIESRAFYSSGLTSVNIGNGVEIIRELAFQNCTELTSVTITALEPPFVNEYSSIGVRVIYVPANIVEKYETRMWDNYEIKPITE